MKFSVIVPTYNRPTQTAEAVGSALAQRQAGIEVEVIVIDDGSTDGTVSSLKGKFAGEAVRVLPNLRRKGPAGARNTGILVATGDCIALLDSDDLFLSNHLVESARVFQQCAEVSVLFGPANYLLAGASVEYMGPNFARKLALSPNSHQIDGASVMSDEFFTHLLQYGCFFNLSTVVMRTAAARSLMHEDLRIAEDYEFWVRLSRTERFACLDRPQICYRLHDENISFEADASVEGHAPRQLDAFRIIRAYAGLTAQQARIIDTQMAELLFAWAYRCRLRRQFSAALRLHCRSLKLGLRRRNLAALLKLVAHSVNPVSSPS